MKTSENGSIQQHREWWYATALLAFVFGLFLISLFQRDDAHVWQVVRAFTEAATVGALADWFAVVALFKAPLGLNFLIGRLGFVGHVAVLPRSQKQIAQRAGEYVGESILTPEMISASLRDVPMADMISDGIKDKKSDIAAIVLKSLPKGARTLGRLPAELLIDAAATRLRNDPDVREQTIGELEKRIEAWLIENPNLVGDKVREQIARIPPETFVARIQGLIGRELQFIRINGTLVGGLVGLMLHGVASVVGR